MTKLAVVCAAIFLMGCANLATKEEVAQHDHEQCLSYGAVVGTDAYVECRTTLHQARMAYYESLDSGAIAALGRTRTTCFPTGNGVACY